MIEVRRQDVGADVVYLPSRRLVILHPDLDYTESLGAVRAAIPDLHIDVAVRLVEKVTPRPRETRKRGHFIRSVAAVAASLSISLLVPGVTPQPASAAKFGDVWRSEMTRMGLSCERESGSWTCVDGSRGVTKVMGFRRAEASLYVVDHPGRKVRVLMIFDTTEAAREYEEDHPDAVVTGRVAAL